jgi:hypothetical protein
VLGNIVAFIVDPVNEVIGLFAGNDARRLSKNISLTPSYQGFSLAATF